MKALILAAGQGTRLRQLTARRAKPMLPIGGKPLLQHTVAWLRDHGVRQIAVNLHHYPGSIVGYFGDGARCDVALHYSYETTLLGTAGAAKHLEHFLDETFVVVYGDVFTNLDLTRLAVDHARDVAAAGSNPPAPGATMVLYRVGNPEECGLVATDVHGRVTRFVEKPPAGDVFTDLAFSGVLVCEPGVLAAVPPGQPFDFGHDLIPRLLAGGAPLYAKPLAAGEYVIDIGTLGGYLRALRTAWTHAWPVALPRAGQILPQPS
jgi:mannose-1-phosphate guanylyltransferase/phosphomannomutase